MLIPSSKKTTGFGWYVTGLVVFSLLTPLAGAHASQALDCIIEPHQLVEVSSSEIGVLAAVNVDKADFVKSGDTLASLRTDVERANLAVARARAQAKSDLELLRREHEYHARKRDRMDQLGKQNGISAQDIDEIQTEEEASRLRFSSAIELQRTLQLEAARDKLSLARRVVYSPIDGFVVHKYKSAGEFVDADPIVQLAQLDPLRVELVVPISMFGKIHVGMQATVIPELPIDGLFIASVVSIDPMMDAATATFGVRLTLPNPDHLLPPGLKCSLSLHAAEGDISHHDPESNQDEVAESPLVLTIDEAQSVPQLGAAETSSVGMDAKVSSVQRDDYPIPVVATKHVDSESMQPEIDERGEPCGWLKSPSGSAMRDATTPVTTLSASASVQADSNSDDMVETWAVMSRKPYSQPEVHISRLALAEVKEYQWLTQGPMIERFSYGQFSSLSGAQNRLEEIQALGFVAEVIPMVESRRAFDPLLTESTSEALSVHAAGHQTEKAELPVSCQPKPAQ